MTSPIEVIKIYGSLSVPLDPPHPAVQVSVSRYACEVYGSGQAERHAYRTRLHHAVSRDLPALGLDGQHFVDVFTGQGSPQNIAKCLRLAARHRIFFHTGPAAGPAPGLSAADGVTRVADQYIGLDCVGFVGNWARLAGIPHASVSRPPLDWLSYTRRLSSVDEIQMGDILVWCNGTHIAVVARGLPVEQRRQRLLVSESALGIATNNYVAHYHATPRTGMNGRGAFSTPFTVDTFRVHGNDVPVYIARLRGSG